ncbi:hypothetical protein M8368_21215, partial [Enterobacter kobei]|nr:hypothetical protein [Enterobacter kobei]
IDILKSSGEAKYLLALEKRYSSLLRHEKFVECLSCILATQQILNAIIHLAMQSRPGAREMQGALFYDD